MEEVLTDGIRVFNGDCRDFLEGVVSESVNPVIVSDPPFNVGKSYKSYNDRMKDDDYLDFMVWVFSMAPSVIIHYPESIYDIAMRMGRSPDRVCSWVYNSNTARQHRDVAFFGVTPDFRRVTQPYKNPNDRRIRALIASGRTGGRIYDWWEVNQVKNVSKKTSHPCQMPLKVMENVIGILPDGVTVIDPFMGTGTTGVACVSHPGERVPFVGIELDDGYYEFAKDRILGAMDGETSSEGQ